MFLSPQNAKRFMATYERVALQPYDDGGNRKEPRYYQRNAIQEVVEAIAKGRNRLLLVMASGTGKTFVAFQIIWRLWKAKRTERVLFLADRNVLVNQTMTNDFRPFGGAMASLVPAANENEPAGERPTKALSSNKVS